MLLIKELEELANAIEAEEYVSQDCCIESQQQEVPFEGWADEPYYSNTEEFLLSTETAFQGYPNFDSPHGWGRVSWK